MLSSLCLGDCSGVSLSYHVLEDTGTYSILLALHGKGKHFINLTNPWLNTSNKTDKSPIPPDKPQALVSWVYHKNKFNDPTFDMSFGCSFIQQVPVKPDD
jgi:hypothetical protein